MVEIFQSVLWEAIALSIPCLIIFYAIRYFLFPKDVSTARYCFVYLYTLSVCGAAYLIVANNLHVVDTAETPLRNVTPQNLYWHIDEWSKIPLTPAYRWLFVYVCGWELADWIVSGLVLKRMTGAHHIHHMLHMTAYLGVCILDRCGTGFAIHLALSEYKELAYPLLRIILKRAKWNSSDKTTALQLRVLAIMDMVFCTFFTGLLWLFAAHVLMAKSIPSVFKVAICAYFFLLLSWWRGRIGMGRAILKNSVESEKKAS